MEASWRHFINDIWFLSQELGGRAYFLKLSFSLTQFEALGTLVCSTWRILNALGGGLMDSFGMCFAY